MTRSRAEEEEGSSTCERRLSSNRAEEGGDVREVAAGLTEYPLEGYERVVAIVTTSEGVSRAEIGRHM